MKINIAKINNLVKLRKLAFLMIAGVGLQLSSLPLTALADGMPDDLPRKKPVKRVLQETPKVAPVVPVQAEEPRTLVKETSKDDLCEWKVRVSGGVTTWSFDKEKVLSGLTAAVDLWRTDLPINYRVAVEGRHMFLEQPAANFAREYMDKTTKITFVRIPFSVEYMRPIAPKTTWYLGAGPDIIHTANDLTETAVGLHLSTRVHYSLNKNFGLSLEAGYMLGSVNGRSSDVKLDNAFITPALAYTF